jgi:peptidoglycan/LPS O-acetylase OafA/YrhL
LDSVQTAARKGNKTTTAPKILPLTSLRFFAAFLVVIQHTVDHPASTYHLLWWGKFLNMGYTAVSFFFVLSGYILAIVYLRHEKPVDKRRFWIARFARIFPLYLVTLIIDTPHALIERLPAKGFRVALEHTAISFATCFFMLQAWFTKLGGIDFPNWSLSVETLFYLVFPWIGVAIWRLNTRQTVLLAAYTYVCGMAAVYGLIHAGLPTVIIKYNPTLHLIPFVMGIVLARLHTDCLKKPELKVRLEQLAFPLIVIGSLLLVVITQYSDRIPYLLMNDGLLTPAFGCLLLAFASGEHLSARIISLPWLVVLGEASYGLYLIHIPLWHLLGLNNLTVSPIAYVLYVASAVALSVVSFYFFETPARQFILQYFTSPSRESMVTISMAQ